MTRFALAFRAAAGKTSAVNMTETAEMEKPADRQLSDPEEWVDRYGDYMYRYALSRLRNPDVAEDVVQESLIAGLKARERFSGRSSERTWLLGILKHKIIDHMRVQYRERPMSELETEDQNAEEMFDRFDWWKGGMSNWRADPAELASEGEFWMILEECVKDLPERMGDAFSLRVMDDMETDEVCNILQVTATNLNVMLHRARLKLRKCLEVNWFTS